MTRFYCFINGKIKKEPKNLELGINVLKRAIPHFSAVNSIFCGKQRIPWHGVNICLLRNTAGPADDDDDDGDDIWSS